MLFRKIEKSALVLAQASDGNPAIATATVLVFMFTFNALEALLEMLIFGERFEHWLDLFFMAAFIAYQAYVVWACAVVTTVQQEESDNAFEIQKD